MEIGGTDNGRHLGFHGKHWVQMYPQAADLTLCVKDRSPKREGVTYATNGRATHPQDLHLVWVQPQPIQLHQFQYCLQAATCILYYLIHHWEFQLTRTNPA